MGKPGDFFRPKCMHCGCEHSGSFCGVKELEQKVGVLEKEVADLKDKVETLIQHEEGKKDEQ